MRPIRIFIDGHTFDREYQGTHIYIRELYAALAKNHPVELFAGAADTKNLQAALPFIATDHLFQYRRNRIGLTRYVKDIPALLKKNHFDYAHFQYISPRPGRHCKFIVTLHDILIRDFKQEFPWLYRFSRNLLFKKSIRGAHIKTTVSKYSLQQISKHYKVAAQTIHLLSSGVQGSYGSRFSKMEATALIRENYGIENFMLYVSRIEPRKNQVGLLHQYLQLKLYQKGISLVFVGKESIPVPKLKRMIAELPSEAQSKIHWFSQVSPEHLEAFYTACRVFIYPTKGEGFGVPPIEAALCKVPVLCSNATAMEDFHFFDPHRFCPQDETEFKDKLTSILDNPPATFTLEKTAVSIRERYNWERTADSFYQILRSNLPS